MTAYVYIFESDLYVTKSPRNEAKEGGFTCALQMI